LPLGGGGGGAAEGDGICHNHVQPVCLRAQLAAFHVSAASFEGGPIAPGSIAAAFRLFDNRLATSTASAASAPRLTALGGAAVTVRDSTGTPRSAAIADQVVELPALPPGELRFACGMGMYKGLLVIRQAARRLFGEPHEKVKSPEQDYRDHEDRGAFDNGLFPGRLLVLFDSVLERVEHRIPRRQ
jgi:hypothetical protein